MAPLDKLRNGGLTTGQEVGGGGGAGLSNRALDK